MALTESVNSSLQTNINYKGIRIQNSLSQILFIQNENVMGTYRIMTNLESYTLLYPIII